MKKVLLVIACAVLLLAGWYMYATWGFATGVNEDTKRRIEFMEIGINGDTLYLSAEDSITLN